MLEGSGQIEDSEIWLMCCVPYIRYHKTKQVQNVQSLTLAVLMLSTEEQTCICHQLHAQFFYSLITSVTLYSSTCFEHRWAHPQEEKIVRIQYLVSSNSVSCHTVHSISARYGSLQSVTIPDTVYIQFSSWRWAQRCSKHVEDHSVIYIIKE